MKQDIITTGASIMPAIILGVGALLLVLIALIFYSKRKKK